MICVVKNTAKLCWLQALCISEKRINLAPGAIVKVTGCQPDARIQNQMVQQGSQISRYQR
jgi:hypothetical protein